MEKWVKLGLDQMMLNSDFEFGTWDHTLNFEFDVRSRTFGLTILWILSLVYEFSLILKFLFFNRIQDWTFGNRVCQTFGPEFGLKSSVAVFKYFKFWVRSERPNVWSTIKQQNFLLYFHKMMQLLQFKTPFDHEPS